MSTGRPASGDQWLELPGARLRYRDSGDGPALVLVHGWTLDLEMWEPQAASLSGELRVLRLDRRGFGLSEGEPSLLGDVEDLAALCAARALHRPVLLGMSQGARVALACALAHQAGIAGLVLDGAPDLLAGDRLEPATPAAQMRARHADPATVKAEWRRHPLMRLHGGDAAAAALLDRILARYPGRDLRPTAAAGSLPPPDPSRLGRLAMPVLLVNGALDDPARIDAARRLCATLPDARHVLIEGAGHLANLDRPDVYNQHCLEFTTACRRGGANAPRSHS